MKIYQQTRAMQLGSDATITIVSRSQVTADKAFTSSWKYIETFEERFSRFRPTSELSLLNMNAGHPQTSSPEMTELLRTALYYQETTEGIFSPFVLPALQKAGYKGSWPHTNTYDSSLDFTGRIAAGSLTIRGSKVVLAEGSALDLGGIGKGYLLDLLADLLHKQQISNFWVSLGGDIIADGHDPDGNPWVIHIEAADGSQTTVATHSNKGKLLAVATSGTIKRQGENWHHIIDPHTCKPAKTDILTASIASTSATEADIYAKCLVILGSDDATEFLQKHGLTSAVIQTKQGSMVYKSPELVHA